MNNDMFDYSYYYSHWHKDTEDSKRNDMDYAKWLYETQGIYPPPPSDLNGECDSGGDETFSESLSSGEELKREAFSREASIKDSESSRGKESSENISKDSSSELDDKKLCAKDSSEKDCGKARAWDKTWDFSGKDSNKKSSEDFSLKELGSKDSNIKDSIENDESSKQDFNTKDSNIKESNDNKFGKNESSENEFIGQDFEAKDSNRDSKTKADNIDNIKDSIENVNLAPSKARVLEIGCGMGRFLLHLKEKGYGQVFGVDIDESQYKIAKKEGLNVFLSDAKAFLLKDSSKYHAIYAFDVLEHIKKSEQLGVLKLIFNHLYENGMLVLQVPNALAPSATYFRYNDFTHTVSYSCHSLGFLLHNAGFHDFCIRPTHNESQSMQDLKLPWARLYRMEFGIEPILTPNIIAIAFKNKKAYELWQKQAPVINNPYKDSSEKSKLKHKIKKLWRKLRKKPTN